MWKRTASTALSIAAAALVVACGGAEHNGGASTAKPPPSRNFARVVKIGGGRTLYAKCQGSGSPTVVMEGGDEDTNASYDYAVPAVAKQARTCVYDRANLGSSGPAKGPRELPDLVGDLEKLLDAAKIAPPYVLVGTSGGGYITAGYAFRHPRDVAGLIFVDTASPYRNPPRQIVKDTAADNPANIEHRDYLQVEKDSWRMRRRIGDIPVRIMSVDFGTAAEDQGQRRNVRDQQGWLVLSPRAKQVVVHTGHAVEEDDPQAVIDNILQVVKAAG
jgi:pimeloyl-ACP methyl ester carboxylesterase